jgi:hypothetical protein
MVLQIQRCAYKRQGKAVTEARVADTTYDVMRDHGPRYTVPTTTDYWMDALNFTQQNPVCARPPDHQTRRRIRSVHASADLRVLPSRAPHDAAPVGETLRLGCEARGCGAAHALFDLRQKAMHGACGAVDGAARLQIPLGNGKAVPTGCSVAEGLPAEGLLGATRLAPSGSPFGRSTSLRDVVEPGMFYVGGSNLQRLAIVAEKRKLDALQGICRLRDSNPRPTVYKTVALPLC